MHGTIVQADSEFLYPTKQTMFCDQGEIFVKGTDRFYRPAAGQLRELSRPSKSKVLV